MTQPRAALLVALCLFSNAALAADWTAFRGSDGTARSDGNPPVKWSAAENIRWKRELPGAGSSSPIILGDRVYVTCYSGYGVPNGPAGAISELKRHLVAVDRKSGEIAWDTPIAADSPEDEYAGFLTEHGYASNTPVTDGERIYVFFGKTGAFAFDLNGKEIWRRNLGKESSGMRWGSAASPVLIGDLVIVNAGEESLSLRGLDKKTGNEVWKAGGDVLELAYGTPSVVTLSDDRKDIVISGAGEVWGLNPQNGKLRWFAETRKQGPVSPSIIVSEGVGYLFGGRGTPTIALKLGGKGDVTQSNVLWQVQQNSYTPTPVLVDGRLYWVTDRGIFYCLDAKTGEKLAEDRLNIDLKGRPVYASPVAAQGRIYQVTSRGGTVVLAAKPQLEILAHNVVEGDDTDFNGTPAIVDDELFLRSNKALYCVSEAPAK